MAVRSSGTGDLEGSVAEPEFGDRRLQAAVEAVETWRSRRASSDGWGGGVSDSPELAAAVRDLICLSSGGDSNGQRAKIALQAAMGHLEDEFRQVLISGTYFLPPDSLQASLHYSIALPARSFSFSSCPNLEALSIYSSPTNPSDDSRTYCSGFSRDSVSWEKLHLYLIDPESSVLLKEIAELIIDAGHAPNLCRVYSETRHRTLMQSLSLLGVKSEHAVATAESGYSVHLDNHRVKLWIQGLKIFVGTILPEERHACAQIFGCNNMVQQDCFAGATTRCTQQLLAVGSAIAKVKDQQYEKVPLLLQMHEELGRLELSLKDMLYGDDKDVISQEVSMLLDELGKTAAGILLSFLNLQFSHDLDEKPALDGSILSLTQYLMGFIKVLAEYNGLLNLILPLEVEEGDGMETTAMGPWECYVLRLLSRLQLKIVEKSESYKDERLQYVFLMNNTMYVLEQSRSSALRVSFRDDWIHENLILRVEQYATGYLRSTWFPALSHLRFKECAGRQVIRAVKEIFKNFNSAFQEISRAQTTWKVPNPQLRQQLRILILHQVLPPYRSFVKRYGCLLQNHNPGKHIKYIPEDIENLVLDLFEG